MESMFQDLRYATRRLLKQPAFAAIAVLSLAIGIGANSAIFTLVNAVLFREQPIESPDELVDIYRSIAGFSHGTFSYPDYEDLARASEGVFSEVGVSRLVGFQTDIDGEIETVFGELVSGNYFPMLGVPAFMGRTLLPEDHLSPGAHQVAFLSHSFWQRKYGGDPEIVGKSIRLNGRSYEIVGVAPREYAGLLRSINCDLYAPVMMVNHLSPSEIDELQHRGNQSMFLKGRLARGADLAQARVVMDRLEQSFKKEYPTQWPKSDHITLVRSQDVIMNPMIDRFLSAGAVLVMTVVGLVLLIACANLASFLLAQMTERKQELALRLALGSSRGRLLRQLLAESVLLAVVGGVAGVVLGSVMLRLLLAADLPVPFPISIDLRLDRTVLSFSVLVTALAGLLLGLAPALQTSKPDLASTLRDESAGGGQRGRLNLRGALVVTQVALSMILLLGAGLFLRSLQERSAVDPGFGYQPAALLTMQTPPDRYSEEESRVFWRQYVERVAALGTVDSVGMTGDLHLSTMNNWSKTIRVNGVEPPPGEDAHYIEFTACDAGFFSAAGIDIVSGRAFDLTDVPDGRLVAVVSEAMARRFWPGKDLLGETFHEGDDVVTVVGVARDAKVRSLGEAPRPFLYEPYSQRFSSFMTVVASTNGDDERLALELLALARQMDPEILAYSAETMSRHLAVGLLPHRLSALLVSSFGLLSLVLASIGLYGVVSYAVAARSREVGIRMSLGADPRDVVKLLMGNGLLLAAVGGGLGFVVALAGARLLGSLLYGISSVDPVAFVTVPIVLGLVAALAAYLPARRASSIDPARALKGD